MKRVVRLTLILPVLVALAIWRAIVEEARLAPRG